MSTHSNDGMRRKTVRDIVALKGESPVVCLTAYTAPVARAADGHCDIVLVGDSLGMVLYGMESTVPVSLDLMVNHGRAVARRTKQALVAVDMPFGSYQESDAQAFHNAAHILKETGAGAVKLEGGVEMAQTVSFLVGRGIPVMGHIGMQPQSVLASGGYHVAGRSEAGRRKILGDAIALSRAGAFCIVLECMDPDLADEVTRAVPVPTIGIGASAGCDGQILVTEDMIGMNGTDIPKFVKRYGNVSEVIEQAVESYAKDVRARKFPAEAQTYKASGETKKIKNINNLK